MTDITIIGLGQMGTRLAELMLDAGKQVTVWNRTASKGDALVARGAAMAADPAAAIAASPVSIAILSDHAAVRETLDHAGVDQAVNGKTVIDLGTTGPEEARHMATWLRARGGDSLDGAIQAAPSQMGQPDTPILMAGDRVTFTRARPLLDILGGGIVHLGEQSDAAAYMDLSTLSYVYGAYAGFLHGARIAESRGISVTAYGQIVRDIAPSFGAFFAHQGQVIASGDFTISESPMRISLSAVERILQSSHALGINTQLPALVSTWLANADAQGLADEELASLIKVLRNAPGG